MKTTFIYSLEDENGNIRYIGKSNNPLRRLSNHLSDKRNLHKVNWINCLLKRNIKPIVNIVDEVSNENWQYWEIYWIQQFKAWGFNLLNATKGGDGPDSLTQIGENNGFHGKIHTQESKLKMRNSKLGIKFINRKSVDEKCRKEMSERNKDKNLSEETKRKISEANKGKITSEDNKRKISEANKGKSKSYEIRKKISEALVGHKHTEETKRKMSQSQKGKIISKEAIEKTRIKNTGKRRTDEQNKRNSESHKGQISTRKIKINVFIYKTGEYIGEYDSYTECGKKLNIDFRKISQVLKGKRNHTGGYTFNVVY
jgi:hypothetical protein